MQNNNVVDQNLRSCPTQKGQDSRTKKIYAKHEKYVLKSIYYIFR